MLTKLQQKYFERGALDNRKCPYLENISTRIFGMHRSADQDSREKIIFEDVLHGIFLDAAMLCSWSSVIDTSTLELYMI